ncbi:hypothetical protein K1719_012589 [Acacia pycnantha]|nr:hypothetical protein K1719_012589 [Acacia pycnantha]
MEMKKLACAVVFVAASLSAVMANGPHIPTVTVGAPDASPSVTVTTSTSAPAPGPSSGAAGLVPLAGATILSVVAYYMHF